MDKNKEASGMYDRITIRRERQIGSEWIEASHTVSAIIPLYTNVSLEEWLAFTFNDLKRQLDDASLRHGAGKGE